MAPHPPLPPLHGLAPAELVPTEMNVVNFLNSKHWERLSINDPQGPEGHFEYTRPDNFKGLVHGQPSPWKLEPDDKKLGMKIFPPLGIKYAHLSWEERASDNMRVRGSFEGEEFKAEQNNPEFYAHLKETAKAHFEKVAKKEDSTKKFTTSGWEKDSGPDIFYLICPFTSTTSKCIMVTTEHYTGTQKTDHIGDLIDPLQFTVTLHEFNEKNWDDDARRQYGISYPSQTLTTESNQWERDFKQGRLRNFALEQIELDPNEDTMQIADNYYQDEDESKEEVANNVVLFFQGSVYTPSVAGGEDTDAAFPICAKAPRASRTVAFLRISVRVVQDRSPAQATYSSDTFYMKFPVKYDWSTKDGWSQDQLEILRTCLIEFPVFDLSNLGHDLADIHLKTVNPEQYRRFRHHERTGQYELDLPEEQPGQQQSGQQQRKRTRHGDVSKDDAMEDTPFYMRFGG